MSDTNFGGHRPGELHPLRIAKDLGLLAVVRNGSRKSITHDDLLDAAVGAYWTKRAQQTQAAS